MQYLYSNIYGKLTIYWGMSGKIRAKDAYLVTFCMLTLLENIGVDKGQSIEIPGLSLGKSRVLGARIERKKLEKDKVPR